MDKKDYVNAYMKTINIIPSNTKKLFAIGMIGLPGVGKTTFAQALGKRLNIYVSCNDTIRRFLNDQGFPGHSPNQELVEFIAESKSKYLYKNGISHVLDADLGKFHKVARQIAESSGAEFYLIHLVTPDNVAIDRVNARLNAIENGDMSNYSRVDEEFYHARKKLHQKQGIPNSVVMTIDTSGDITSGIDKIEKLLKDNNVL